MFAKEKEASIRALVQRVTGIELPFRIRTERGEALSVTLCNGDAVICAEDENALSRGYFLLSRWVREGKTSGSIFQRRHFASCGVMADVSRGAVMKTDAVKRYMDQLACLGMNMLMLYTEDIYEVPQYPYLGHLRGRYSHNDLQELDGYAASLGIELVPCIQTLGHMRQFLQWSAMENLRDQKDILLADDEKTYAFIEAQICAMRACMRSGRIHIGMDEAHGVGFGEYWLKNGDTDRFALLRRHLARVVQICEKYGFTPVMWSDMFFRLGSQKNDYYDAEAIVPQQVIDSLPPVDLCYWDYYHDDPAFFDHMLKQHKRMGKTVFAGGIWTWSGFLPQVKRTEATMFPALSACVANGVDTVFATMWGDDGSETNLFLASGLLPIFSEACWQGIDCSREEIALTGECLTGHERSVLEAMGEIYKDAQDLRPAKGYIWCDPFYPLLSLGEDTPDQTIARAQSAMRKLEKYEENPECRYASLVLDVVCEKARLVRDMREKYLTGDRVWLRETAHVAVPRILQKYDRLMKAHRELWRRDMKRFGWEVICLRYGAVTARLEDCAEEIKRWLCGEIPVIEELCETPLHAARGETLYETLVTPSADLGMGF